MARLILLGATGSLGSHVLRLGLAAGHEITVHLRSPSKLSHSSLTRVAVHQGDLTTVAAPDLARIIRGHDVAINCAGHVTDGPRFVDIVERLITAVELVPSAEQPVCWFLAGAALLDIGTSGRRGVDLPGIESTYWPHRVNLERLSRSGLDWRLLCPGPMVEGSAIGLDRMQVVLDTVPVPVTEPSSPSLLPVFMSLVPRMTVPYADAAALMLANLNRGDAMARHRVGLVRPASVAAAGQGVRASVNAAR